MPYVYGFNADIDTGTETLWPGGGLWVPPTTARLHAIASSDVDDNAGADTGGRTLFLRGLSATFTEQAETVALDDADGTTPVDTALAYTFIESLEMLTAGSTGANEGAITATAATDSTVSAHMAAGRNVSNGCILACPAGVWRRITGASVSAGVAATGDFAAFLSVRRAGSALWLAMPLFGLLDGGSSAGSIGLDVVLGPGDFARLDVQSSADNQAVHGSIQYERA